jgi:hypothetical protein
MRTYLHGLLHALAISALFATCASALPPPYDFTGHWSGTATSKHTGQTAPLSVDFAATPSPRKFTGSATLEVNQTVVCAFKALYKRNLTLHPTCSGRTGSTVIVHFDPAAQSLTGSFPLGHHDVARFMLVRQAA